MKFEGSYDIGANRKKVWEFIIDPNKVGQCLPDLKALEVQAEDRFIAIIHVGIGLVKADLNCQLRIVEKTAPSHARLKGSGSGSGSSVDLDSLIDLTETATGTRINYRTNVNVGGVLVGLGQRMMENATAKMVDEVFRCVKAKLEAPS